MCFYESQQWASQMVIYTNMHHLTYQIMCSNLRDLENIVWNYVFSNVAEEKKY